MINKNFRRRTAVGFGACILLAGAAIATQLQAPTPGGGGGPTPAPLCYQYGLESSSTGCIAFQNTPCAWYSPNYGVVSDAEYMCCYSPTTFQLIGYSGYTCTTLYNGGCCNWLTGAPACPAAACPAQIAATTSSTTNPGSGGQ